MTTKPIAIYIDSGDTLVDESTQVYERADSPIVTRAELVPGARELVHFVKSQGYLLAMVCDGYRQSFINIYTHLGLLDEFDALVDSETVRAEKPNAAMFRAAGRALGIAPADHGRCIMIGNNLERDVAGANRVGIRSVHYRWSPRYPHKPKSTDEQPDYVVERLEEVIELLQDR